MEKLLEMISQPGFLWLYPLLFWEAMMEEFEKLQSLRRNCLANHLNWLENLRIRKLNRNRYAMYGTLSTHLPSDFALSSYFLQNFPNEKRLYLILKLFFFGRKIHTVSTWFDDAFGFVSGTDDVLIALALADVDAIELILSIFALQSVEIGSIWFEKSIPVNVTRGTLLLNTTSNRFSGANGSTFTKMIRNYIFSIW